MKPKFRAWDNRVLISPGKLTSGEIIDEYDEIMQYTGFKDLCGIEIYECDIIMIDESCIAIVNWVDDCWAATQDGEYFCGLWNCIYNHRCEVIGIKYEN